MLGTRQLSPPGRSSERNEIIGDPRHSTSRTLLPRCIGSRVDDHLADDSPAGVMRIATRDKKPREGLCNLLGVGLGPVNVEMSERCPHLATSVHCPCEVTRSGPRSVSRVVDQPTVLPGIRVSRRTDGGRVILRRCKHDRLGSWTPPRQAIW